MFNTLKYRRVVPLATLLLFLFALSLGCADTITDEQFDEGDAEVVDLEPEFGDFETLDGDSDDSERDLLGDFRRFDRLGDGSSGDGSSGDGDGDGSAGDGSSSDGDGDGSAGDGSSSDGDGDGDGSSGDGSAGDGDGDGSSSDGDGDGSSSDGDGDGSSGDGDGDGSSSDGDGDGDYDYAPDPDPDFTCFDFTDEIPGDHFEALQCTLGQGYWKNNHDKWPAQTDSCYTSICDLPFTDILDLNPSSNNAWQILVQQWIAAVLNIDSGVIPSQEVAAAIVEAEALLLECKISSADRAEALDLAALLDEFNNTSSDDPSSCQ